MRQQKNRNEENVDHDENIYVLLYPKLQRYSYFLTENKWDGDDVTHDAILKAMQHYPDKESITPALIKTIAHHHWIDTNRKRKKEELQDNIEEHQVESNEGISNLTDAVEYLVNRFTPKQAVIFILKEAFQYRCNEIAEILETTELAVKSTLFRARKHLNNDTQQPLHVDSAWPEEEKVQLSELFYQALKVQDPAYLITMIPFIRSLRSDSANPKLIFGSNHSKTTSPLNTIFMAA